jgi:hypothetical protein
MELGQLPRRGTPGQQQDAEAEDGNTRAQFVLYHGIRKAL